MNILNKRQMVEKYQESISNAATLGVNPTQPSQVAYTTKEETSN